MLQHGWTLMISFKVKQGSSKRPYTVLAHSYDMSNVVKIIKTEYRKITKDWLVRGRVGINA